MTEKQTYWMRNVTGELGQMAGADQRDEWTNRGWTEADEPSDGDRVWMSHADVADPGLLPWGAREGWPGWSPSAPRVPVDPTRDPQPIDVPAEKPAAEKPTKSAAKVAPNQEA